MDTPHVAYVCANRSYRLTDPSGYATHIRELSKHLQTKGFRISILLPSLLASGPAPTGMAPRPHRFRRFFPSYVWNLLKDIGRIMSLRSFERTLARRLNEGIPSIIYERLGYEGSAALRWALAHQVPIVFEIHDPILEHHRLVDGPHPLKSCFRRKVGRALGSASALVVVSGALKQWLIDQGIDATKIHVVHNGVNLDIFRLDNVAPAGDTKSALAIVGFVGSALQWHALPLLITAFADVVREKPAILLLVGLSDTSSELRQLVQDLGLANHVRFMGSIPHEQVPQIIASMDVAVLPGANEYQNPIKLFEYGAMGRAVIAPRTTPIQEILTDGEDAILIPSGSKAELTKAILRLLKDPVLRERLGQKLMHNVRAQHGWSHSASKVARVLQSATQNSKSPI